MGLTDYEPDPCVMGYNTFLDRFAPVPPNINNKNDTVMTKTLFQSKIYRFADPSVKAGLVGCLKARLGYIVDKYGISHIELAKAMGYNTSYFSFIKTQTINRISDNIVRCLAISFHIYDDTFRQKEELERVFQDGQTDRIISPEKIIVDDKTFLDLRLEYEQYCKDQRDGIERKPEHVDLTEHLVKKEECIDPNSEEGKKITEKITEESLFPEDQTKSGRKLLDIIKDEKIISEVAHEIFDEMKNKEPARFNYAKSLPETKDTVKKIDPKLVNLVKELNLEKQRLIKNILAIDNLLAIYMK